MYTGNGIFEKFMRPIVLAWWGAEVDQIQKLPQFREPLDAEGRAA